MKTCSSALILVGSVALVLSLTGCSSVTSHIFTQYRTEEFPRVYSGVWEDVRQMPRENRIIGACLIFDLPFSATLDTLLLPYDLLFCHPNDRDNAKRPDEAGTSRNASNRQNNPD